MPPQAGRRRRVAAVLKIELTAGQATPAPPVGTALGPHAVNIMEFCKQYNAATQAQAGNVVPVVITIYEDRTFSFVLKTPPAAVLLRKAAGVEKGSAEPHREKGGTVTRPQAPKTALAAPPSSRHQRPSGCAGRRGSRGARPSRTGRRSAQSPAPRCGRS